MIFFGLFFSMCLNAQHNFIIDNVRFFDGESVQENMYVHVVNGIVKEVVNHKIESNNAIRIDGANKTLIPALANAHVHVWSPDALHESAKAGVLNVFDMAGYERTQIMLRSYKDSTNYANYFASGAPATAPKGHGTQFGYPSPTLTKASEAETFINDRVTAGADYIKIIVEPWMPTLDNKIVKALVEASHKQNKIAVAHISKVKDAYEVLNNNMDGLVHIWKDTIMPSQQFNKLVEEKSFFIVPTLLTRVLAYKSALEKKSKRQILTEVQLKSEVKRLYDAGIKIIAGTDPPNRSINYGTDLHKELILFSEAGIPNIDVLKSATSFTADAFGLENKGKLIKGYAADMILINGNPIDTIEDISNIEIVWKHGKRVE